MPAMIHVRLAFIAKETRGMDTGRCVIHMATDGSAQTERGMSLPFLRRLRQRRAPDGRPIDGVHVWRKPRLDLFDCLPLGE